MATRESENIAAVLALANQPSLVKYSSPVVVGNVRKNMLLSATPPKVIKPPIPEGCQENFRLKKESQEFFDKTIGCRELVIDGDIWRQSVSSTPATRTDVITLAAQLSARVKQKNGNVIGICSTRRELHSQCFDEIIRQVTINCTERGLLLVKVRNETVQTLQAYRSIFESASAYAMRKALWAMSKQSEMERTIRDTQIESEILASNLEELQQKYDDLRFKFEENARIESLKHAEEADILRQNNERLKRLLERSIIVKEEVLMEEEEGMGPAIPVDEDDDDEEPNLPL